MLINIDILVQEVRWDNKLHDIKSLCRDATELVLNHFDVFKNINEIEVSIIFTNNAEIQDLNKIHMQKDKPTNVLSFPVEEFYQGNLEYINEFSNNPDNILHLGDIILAYETIKKEADEQNKTFKNHTIHLIIHSILHLIGFDHMEKEEAENMESLEIGLLEKLNIPSPY